ncbi:anti-sigma factor family protein [Nocardia sp. CA-107356]|uniref:anti-sigma factor family protein n=1 Tax=Nocardia sp. CA-107356 TaxID=3239972 RepID=UPI003D8FFEB0
MTDIADDYSTWDAPYVLGSLTRAERQEYEEHLAGCPVCQAAVSDLAVLPGLLALVEPETALAMIEPLEAPVAEAEPPTQLLPRLAYAAEKRRRRSRWVSIGAAVAAAAAAVAIAVPVITSITATDTTSGTEQVVAERSMEPIKPNPVTASFKVVRADSKTRIVMTCSYGPSDQRYSWNLDLYVIGTDGSQSKLDQWPAGPGTELTIDRTIDKAPDQIQAVQIRLASTGETLLSGTV